MTMTPLATYLLGALLAWSPARTHKTETIAQWHDRAAAIASDVADVVTAPTEPSCGSCATLGLRLLAVGLEESNFDLLVEQGRCTPHTCDEGYAWSAWQIHPDGGLTLDGARYRSAAGRPHAWLLEHFAEVVTAPMLVADRKVAARMALHMWRTSPSLFSTAKAAVALATRYRATHALSGTP
jgi:hypothetical protein